MKTLAPEVAANPEDHTIAEVVQVLEFTADQYHNNTADEGESFLTDAQWDALYRYLQLTDPVNKYLIGIGATVRGDKVNLAYLMPGLDQVHEGDVEKWLTSNNLLGEKIIAMDKMDGNSGQIIYDTDGNLQTGYSRGSSTEGQDLTRHFLRMKNLPKTEVGLDFTGSFVVRVEIEMKDEVFDDLNGKGLLRSRSGKVAKNARNYVSGQLNSTEAEQVFYDNVDVIAYQVMFPELDSKVQELKALRDSGFTVVDYLVMEGSMVDDDVLATWLNSRHSESPFALDGLVLVVNERSVQNRFPPRDKDKNPAHSRKFKVVQENNFAITKIVAIHRKVSSDGYIVPRIEIVPVKLVGVTVTFATAYNELYLKKNNIGVGTEIRIIRSGDVIPKIVEIITPTAYALPDPAEFGEYEWTEPNADGERVNIVLLDVENSDAANQQKLIKFFTNLGVEFLAKKSLAKLFEAGLEMPEDIINASVADIQAIVGEANGRKGMASLAEKLNPVEPWMLAGVTQYFGRGVGRRKMKKIYDATGRIGLNTFDNLLAVEGIESKTARKIIDGGNDFNAFLLRIAGKYTFAEQQEAPSGGALEGAVVVFTGFRDADAQSKIEAMGGRVGSSVSSKTTLVVTKDPTSNSGKVKKARDLGIEIIGPDELYTRLA